MQTAAKVAVDPKMFRGLINGIVSSIHPPQQDFEDFCQEGWVGLLDAARRYDPDTGTSLTTFARRRISGQMCDYLRRQDPVGRYDRKRYKERGEPGPVTVLLDDVLAAGAEIPSKETSPAELAVTKRVVHSALDRVSERSRYVLVQFYFLERSIMAIGVSLGVGVARVHQLKRKALQECREILTSHPPPASSSSATP